MATTITRKSEDLYRCAMAELAYYGYVRCTFEEVPDVFEILDPAYWDRGYNEFRYVNVDGEEVDNLNMAEGGVYDIGKEEWLNGNSIIVIHEVEPPHPTTTTTEDDEVITDDDFIITTNGDVYVRLAD